MDVSKAGMLEHQVYGSSEVHRAMVSFLPHYQSCDKPVPVAYFSSSVPKVLCSTCVSDFFQLVVGVRVIHSFCSYSLGSMTTPQ